MLTLTKNLKRVGSIEMMIHQVKLLNLNLTLRVRSRFVEVVLPAKKILLQSLKTIISLQPLLQEGMNPPK